MKPHRPTRGSNPNRPSRQRFLDCTGDDRPSALRKVLPLRPENPTDSIIRTKSTAKYFEYAGEPETVEEHIVPRKSLTRKLLLRVFPPQVEVEQVKGRQLDKKSGRMVETTDNRVVWKSDRSLLRNNKPENLENIRFKRQTSRSRRIKTEIELPAVVEVSQDTALDPDPALNR